MNNPFTKFIDALSNMEHTRGRLRWTNEVDMLHRTVMIVMTDWMSNMRLARMVPYDYISDEDPEGQARKLIEDMYTEMESKTMMSVEEAIDQLEDLESDIWSGAKDGRPIYVADDDYRAIQVALEALREKVGEVDEITD